MKNLAAPWGTYNVDRTIIQVQKGENTLRIASNQDSTGWMFYINYIEYSKVFTDLSQPAYTVDAPRPEKITDKIEFEILENNANAKIDEITDGRERAASW